MPTSAPMPVLQRTEYARNPRYDIYEFRLANHIFHVMPHLDEGIVIAPYHPERDAADQSFARAHQRRPYPVYYLVEQGIPTFLSFPYLLVKRAHRQLYAPAWGLTFALPRHTNRPQHAV